MHSECTYTHSQYTADRVHTFDEYFIFYTSNDPIKTKTGQNGGIYFLHYHESFGVNA